MAESLALDCPFRIRTARSPQDLEIVLRLFKAYATSLGIDLAFQGFNAEIAGLPGKYAPPVGDILLAFDVHGEPLGCVALKPLLPEGYCEMKRLYVFPEARSLGLGKTLAESIIELAYELGYTHMRLDTLSSMMGAISLYRKLGFKEIGAYYNTPLADTIFMELSLKPGHRNHKQSS